MRTCPKCGFPALSKESNFCTRCSTKLVTTCFCWVLNRRFDCKEDHCPGFKVLVKTKDLFSGFTGDGSKRFNNDVSSG